MKSIRYYVVLFLVIDLLSVVALFAKPHPKIVFISKPITIAHVGVLYSYDAEAKSSDSAETITYKLHYPPTGMTIDSVSGLIQWTPVHKGYFSVMIHARGDSGGSGNQSFAIRVLDAVGTISGQVVDAVTLLPIPHVNVQLFPSSKYIILSFIGMPIFGYSGVTDSLGMYSISNIDTGVYYAQAVKAWRIPWTLLPWDQYLPVWWKNSPTIIGADPINIIPDSTMTINFQMRKRVIPQKITVSGTVTDSSGKPIKHALVIVSKVKPEPDDLDENGEESAPPAMPDLGESTWGRIEDACGNGLTDSNGVYSAQVFAGFTYIASAYAKGYVIQFYNGKVNVLEADRFTPANDTTGIDFSLTPVPKATSLISGSVQDSNGQGVVSRLILFPARKPYIGPGRTVSTDSNGNFQFENLYDGKYLLMAVPYKEYLPAFYKKDAFGVWNWKEADTISLAGQETGLIVGVVKKQNQGAGFVHGRVRTKDGKPVEGAIVYAVLQPSGVRVNYAVTGADGSYDLGGLPPADYTLVADKPEFVATGTAQAAIDYINGGGAVVPDITFEELTAVEPGGGSGSAIPTAIALYQNYPNPFNPSTHIRYDLPHDAHVLLKVFNIIGQEVALILDGNQVAGSHTIEFDASQLPSGVYFYRMQVEKSVMTKKMIIMR